MAGGKQGGVGNANRVATKTCGGRWRLAAIFLAGLIVHYPYFRGQIRLA